jgi:hypothetical protein
VGKSLGMSAMHEVQHAYLTNTVDFKTYKYKCCDTQEPFLNHGYHQLIVSPQQFVLLMKAQHKIGDHDALTPIIRCNSNFCERFAAFVEIGASIFLEEEGDERKELVNQIVLATGGFDLSSFHPHLQTF